MQRYIPATLSCFVLIALWSGLSSCKTQPGNSSLAAQQCQTKASIVDYSGLDGCGLLLKFRDGTLASPVQWPVSEDSLYDGMPVSLDYEEADEMMSTCMKEDIFIRIRCLHLPDSGDRKCTERIGPRETEWMRQVFMDEDPWEVARYDGRNMHYFYFQRPGKGVLYNCYGDSICDIRGRVYNACARKLSRLKNNKVIWKKDEK